MSRLFTRRDLVWRDRAIYRRRGGHTPLASIEFDEAWPLWRVRLPDGTLSDLLNLSRARDAAVELALAQLNNAPDAAPTMTAAGASPTAAPRASAGVRLPAGARSRGAER